MVHLTDMNHVRSIKRVGIKRRRFRFRDDGIGGAVYAMPILPNYWVSHQWLRELRRRGQRVVVGVDFRIPAREKVLVGHYGGDHRLVTVGEATRILLAQEDPRGWEMLVPRDIAPAEIVRVREISQVVGWRFSPAAKGTKPCGCDYCQGGLLNSRRIREGYGATKNPWPKAAPILEKLAVETDADETWRLLLELQRTRVRGRDALALLLGLAANPASDVHELAAELILKNWRWSGYDRLRASTVPRVRKVIEDWLEERQP